MLPGVAPPGRAPPPGRGGIPPGPGRGPWGRGMGRSTGWAEENGLLPTRGGRGRPGFGPGGAAGPGRGPAGAGATGAGAGAATVGAGGAGGAAGVGAAGLGAAGAAGAATASAAGTLAAGRLTGASGAFAPPKDSRNRRATGASTVEDADLTNSPCSLRRARTSLLVTPSSFANSCTRALPATTSPSLEATAVGRPRLGFSYDAWSSGLHGVLMFFATCSLPGGRAKCSTTAAVSGVPVIRNARLNARRRIAAVRQRSSGCNHAPRPGSEPDVSTATACRPFPVDTATIRSSSTASSRFRQPMHVRTG